MDGRGAEMKLTTGNQTGPRAAWTGALIPKPLSHSEPKQAANGDSSATSPSQESLLFHGKTLLSGDGPTHCLHLHGAFISFLATWIVANVSTSVPW